MSEVPSEYKDRLFNFIFGREENRAWTLSLYNAINHTQYKNPQDIELNMLREILYLGMRNDLSFLIYSKFNLYEQQSSCHPDMPLRELQYAGNLYETYIKEHHLNKFGKTLIQLPVPRLVVFYHGTDMQPDELILQLGDSFPESEKSFSDIKIRVRMININYRRNNELLTACRPLKEYAWLTDVIRKKQAAGESPDTAVKHAIDQMPPHFLLRAFFEARKNGADLIW